MIFVWRISEGVIRRTLPLIRPAALPRNSESVAPIVSFVGEYSAHLPAEDIPRVHAIGIFAHRSSHRSESLRSAIRFCAAIPNWVG
jgi:hypothetical protein